MLPPPLTQDWIRSPSKPDEALTREVPTEEGTAPTRSSRPDEIHSRQQPELRDILFICCLFYFLSPSPSFPFISAQVLSSKKLAAQKSTISSALQSWLCCLQLVCNPLVHFIKSLPLLPPACLDAWTIFLSNADGVHSPCSLPPKSRLFKYIHENKI